MKTQEDNMEEISFPFSFETETKIAKAVEESQLSRDQVIARALDNFLSSLGF